MLTFGTSMVYFSNVYCSSQMKEIFKVIWVTSHHKLWLLNWILLIIWVCQKVYGMAHSDLCCAYTVKLFYRLSCVLFDTFRVQIFHVDKYSLVQVSVILACFKPHWPKNIYDKIVTTSTNTGKTSLVHIKLSYSSGSYIACSIYSKCFYTNY